MKLSAELTWRGLIKDKTFGDASWLDKPQSFYLGIDASADSLTVGNLAIIVMARRLAKAGWKAFLVMGGGTSLVGDPGGKTEERQLLSRETVKHNIAHLKGQVEQLFRDEQFKVVDNYDWLAELKYLEFLRDVGKHFSMTELMQRDFVTERMGQGGAGISYAEFSYSLVQGYDFWHLFKQHGVVLQIGGSDQWGNLLSGVALIRKKESKAAQALSMPLTINKATGVKFGKSEGGAIWLDPAKTSPTQFYQFWINVDDEGVENYLKIYTELSKEEIEKIAAKHKEGPGARFAQTRLAEEVTKLVHGSLEMQKAEQVTDILTGKRGIGALSDKAHQTYLMEIRSQIHSIHSSDNAEIADVLVKTGLASSKTEARRFLVENAISINGQKVSRENLEPGDFQNGRLLLRRGRAFKDSALVELEE